MRQKLEAFLALCEQYQEASHYDRLTIKPIEDSIADALPTVEQIVRQLDPRLLTTTFGFPDHLLGMSQSERQTRKALAVLRDREDWKRNLAPDSPSLTADEFHPTVWKGAAEVWNTGEYKMAAQAACISLSAHIKEKAGSPPLNDRQLVAQVFSWTSLSQARAGCTSPATTQTRTGSPANRGCNIWRRGHSQGSATSLPMTTPFGPSTRRWSILPFSLWSHDGQTRLNLHPCDRNEPAGAWSTSPAAPPGGRRAFTCPRSRPAVSYVAGHG
jgi:hypothetical protein